MTGGFKVGGVDGHPVVHGSSLVFPPSVAVLIRGFGRLHGGGTYA
jgi:hypothetical protein